MASTVPRGNSLYGWYPRGIRSYTKTTAILEGERRFTSTGQEPWPATRSRNWSGTPRTLFTDRSAPVCDRFMMKHSCDGELSYSIVALICTGSRGAPRLSEVRRPNVTSLLHPNYSVHQLSQGNAGSLSKRKRALSGGNIRVGFRWLSD